MRKAHYTYLHSGTVGEGQLVVTTQDGATRRAHADPAVSDAVLDVRRTMYSPDKGTWYTARVTITSDLQMSMDFDYDHEPQWAWKTPPSVYVDDLKMFPRYESAIPDWLCTRLAEAGHPVTSDTSSPDDQSLAEPRTAPSTTHVAPAASQGPFAEHHHRITEELRHHAPLVWTQMRCTYKQAAGTVEALTTATLANGEQQTINGLMDLYRALYALRAAMHEADPDAPLWFTATATLAHDGDLQLDLDTDHEPAWDDPVPASTYADDLARFPRPESTHPAWLRHRLTEAATPNTAGRTWRNPWRRG